MRAPSDRLASQYVGHHRSGSNEARNASRALKRTLKEPSKKSVQRAKRAREQEIAANSPHVSPPGHLFDDDVGHEGEAPHNDAAPHVLDGDQMLLFGELNMEAEDAAVAEDALLHGDWSTLICDCG